MLRFVVSGVDLSLRLSAKRELKGWQLGWTCHLRDCFCNCYERWKRVFIKKKQASRDVLIILLQMQFAISYALLHSKHKQTQFQKVSDERKFKLLIEKWLKSFSKSFSWRGTRRGKTLFACMPTDEASSFQLHATKHSPTICASNFQQNFQ